MTSKTAGIVTLKAKTSNIAMPIEVHVETEDAWEGYNLANPFGGYRAYSKDQFVVMDDRRQDI